MAVRTIAVDGASPMTLNDLEAFVDAAAAHGGGWLPITFHDVCDQAASNYKQPHGQLRPDRHAVSGSSSTGSGRPDNQMAPPPASR